MIDLEKTADEVEDVYRPDFDWVSIFKDGTIISD